MAFGNPPRNRQPEPGAVGVAARGVETDEPFEIGSRSDGGIPAPVSETTISAQPPTARSDSRTRPPSGVCLIAFSSRFIAS